MPLTDQQVKDVIKDIVPLLKDNRIQIRLAALQRTLTLTTDPNLRRADGTMEIVNALCQCVDDPAPLCVCALSALVNLCEAPRRPRAVAEHQKVVQVCLYHIKGLHKCANPACSKMETKRGEMKCCGACKSVYYCSAECQRAHWNAHKTSCKVCASNISTYSDTMFELVATMLLCNITREKEGAELVVKQPFFVETIVSRLEEAHFPPPQLADVLMNVTQTDVGQKCLFEKTSAEEGKRWIADMLEALIDPKELVEKSKAKNPNKTDFNAAEHIRKAYFGVLKNLSFTEEHRDVIFKLHETNPKADVIAALVLPLRGNEMYVPEEDKLMYEPLKNENCKDRKREEDPVVKKTILETLMLYLSKRRLRLEIKKLGLYPIFREYDLTEKDEETKQLILEVVNCLVLDESDGSDKQNAAAPVGGRKAMTSDGTAAQQAEVRKDSRVEQLDDDGIETI